MTSEVKKLSTEPYKGVRDFYPEDMAVQNYIFSVWKKVAEQFGYQEYAASLLEPSELYRSKGSEEIVNEQMFTFTDRGGREVALRPEMTPSLARMIAARSKSLKFPLRWYTIANCFRYERPQRGRKREHWQLNADVMGVAGVDAEVEIISLAHAIMKALGAKDEDFGVKIGHKDLFRIFLETILLVDKESTRKILRIVDRREKLSENEYEEELRKVTREDVVQQIIRGPKSFIDENSELTKVVASLMSVTKKLKQGDEKKGWAPVKNVVIDYYLTRGFDYYTGMVFEVFDTNQANRRSLFGGGRYDNLLELFGVDPVPTVGFGMGDVTIRDFLETHHLPMKN